MVILRIGVSCATFTIPNESTTGFPISANHHEFLSIDFVGPPLVLFLNTVVLLLPLFSPSQETIGSTYNLDMRFWINCHQLLDKSSLVSLMMTMLLFLLEHSAGRLNTSSKILSLTCCPRCLTHGLSSHRS